MPNKTPNQSIPHQTKAQTILVTGGAGFIGTHLCRSLKARGHTVRVLDLKEPTPSVTGVEYIRGDVRDQALLERAVEGADVVYHLAATVSVPVCQKDPADSYSNNFTSTICVLEALRKQAKQGRITRLAFASTAALYGHKGREGVALQESDTATEFISFYAAQKHASEQAIALYSESYGIPAMIFRFFNVFGPGQDPSSPYSGVISIFTRLAREGKPLPLNGGGTQTRDFISVHDLVRAQTKALEIDSAQWTGKPINLGSGAMLTIRDLAGAILEVSRSQSSLVDAPAREGDVIHSLADISRAREVVAFHPEVTLRGGLEELINSINSV